METTLLQLSPEDRFKFALTLPIKLVLDICKKNNTLNTTICFNEEFWKQRYIKQYGSVSPEPMSWKELYLSKSLTSAGGKVWVQGSNSFGELGLGYIGMVSEYTLISSLKNKILKVASGSGHALFLDIHNNVWVSGSNSNGQLGLGNFNNQLVPVKIPNIKAKEIACGSEHSLLIDLNNNVLSFGSGAYGQLGLGELNEQVSITTPRQVPNIKALQIDGGTYHSIILDLNNNVWTTGINTHGRLGIENLVGSKIYTFHKIPNIKAKQISTSVAHTLLIDMDNNVFAFGMGSFSRFGLDDIQDRHVPTQIPNIKAKYISAGRLNSSIITLDDGVLNAGSNSSGQLGLRFISDDIFVGFYIVNNLKGKQISVGNTTMLLLDENDDVWRWGSKLVEYEMVKSGTPEKIPNIKGSYVCTSYDSIYIIENTSLISFEELEILFQDNKIVKVDIDPSLQVYYKALNNVYLLTLTDTAGIVYYGYAGYDQSTNKISPPKK